MPSATPSGEPDEVRILAIPGSVRSDSINLRLLKAAARVADREPARIVDVQADVAWLPPFVPDGEYPESVERLRESVAGADAVLVATPEYNGSIPGGLKNAIDWVAAPPGHGPIRGKPVAVIGADRSEVGSDWAHADARKVFEAAGARVVREGLDLRSADEAFGPGDELVEPEQAEQLERVIDELVEESRSP